MLIMGWFLWGFRPSPNTGLFTGLLIYREGFTQSSWTVQAKESEEEQLARLEKFAKELEGQEAVQT